MLPSAPSTWQQRAAAPWPVAEAPAGAPTAPALAAAAQLLPLFDSSPGCGKQQHNHTLQPKVAGHLSRATVFHMVWELLVRTSSWKMWVIIFIGNTWSAWQNSKGGLTREQGAVHADLFHLVRADLWDPKCVTYSGDRKPVITLALVWLLMIEWAELPSWSSGGKCGPCHQQHLCRTVCGLEVDMTCEVNFLQQKTEDLFKIH